ncbi:exo-alpha-sialidase [Micrococcales bacterium 31B]|nr:exo-alpha-sialidase [Micrococcales bacterium 31B]
MQKPRLNRRHLLLSTLVGGGALAAGLSHSPSASALTAAPAPAPAPAAPAAKPGSHGATRAGKRAGQAVAGASAAFLVFKEGDATGSTFFRIPFMLNTSAGTVIAGTDANFGSTGDSADNIDCAVRRKPRAARCAADAGWKQPEVPDVLHLRDYADEFHYQQQSASLIDGLILQDTLDTQRIHLVIDLWTWNGGIFEFMDVDATGTPVGRRSRAVAPGDGFAQIGDRRYLLLSSTNATGDGDGQTGNLNRNLDRSAFDHVADVYGPKDKHGRARVYRLHGTPRPYGTTAAPVDDSNLALGAATDYSIAPDLALYQGNRPLMTTQLNAAGTPGPKVPLKAAYKASPLQMYNTAYLYHVTSDDDGKSWQAAGIISGGLKTEDSTYFITGPGNSIQVQRGAHRGRLIVPVYHGPSPERTAVVFSDDNGATWTRGADVPSTLNISESNVVERPDGTLQIFMRTSGTGLGRVSTAHSTDGGATWSQAASAFGDVEAEGIGCQVSAVGLPYDVTLADGTRAPGVAVTTAMARSRDNGVVHIGGFVDGGVQWVGQVELTGAAVKFAYSSMAVLDNGTLAVLYESSENTSWTDGLKAMYYREIPKAELPLAAG